MKQKIMSIVSLFCLILVVFLQAPPASAHRSGCHAWHSCPSDRGTYICGDTGHCNYCPDNQYCLNGSPRLGGLSEPTNTPIPNTPVPTPLPTPIPTPKPTSTPTPTPTPSPEVKGETTQSTPSPVAVEESKGSETSTSDTILGLGILAAIGGGAFWIGRGIWKRLTKQPPQQIE